MIKPFIDRGQDVRIGSVSGKLYAHINDETVHLTPDEKKILEQISQGDSSSDDISGSIDDLQYQLNNKADKDEIPTKVSQLENDLNYISEIPDYYTTEEEVKLLIQSFLTGGDFEIDLSEIQDQIDKLTEMINNQQITIDQLKQQLSQLSQSVENIENNIEDLETNLENKIEEIINNIIEEGGISLKLQPATATRLGGIKVGAGLGIEADGTLSVAGGSGTGGDVDITVTDKRYIRKDQDDFTDNRLTVNGLTAKNDRLSGSERGLTVENGAKVSDKLEVEGGVIVDGDSEFHDKLVGEDIESTEMVHGMLGRGFFLGMNENNSLLEIDDLLVRNKAVFAELEIRKLSYVNGSIVLSAAGGIIESVEVLGNGDFKCYLKSDDGTTATTNSFQVNDLVRCQTFDIKPGVYENVSNKFYWRQVVDLGTEDNRNWITLSKTQKSTDTSDDATGTPAEGDTIVQFGNTTEPTRQNIILISATDFNAPSITMYSKVFSFNLSQATLSTQISPDAVKFRSTLFKLISGNDEYRVAIDRGAWDAETTYYYWDRVSHKGSLWLCCYDDANGHKGKEPGVFGSEGYWLLQVSKGDVGDADDKPSIVFDEPIIVTSYDGTRYYPSIVSKEIKFHAVTFDGYNIEDDKILSYSVISNTSKIPVTKGNNSVVITGCSLEVGDSATITVTADIQTGESPDQKVSVTNTISVLCIDYPDTEHTFQAYVTPESYTSNYQIATDEDGKIKSIQWPKTFTYTLMIFEGTKLFNYDGVTVADSTGTQDRPNVHITLYAGDSEASSPVNYSRAENGTLQFQINSSNIQYGTIQISDSFKSPSYSGSSYYPETTYSVNLEITAGDWKFNLRPQLNLNIFSESSIFENTVQQLTSIKQRVEVTEDGLEENKSQITQTASEINSRVEQINTSVDGIEEQVSQISQTAGQIQSTVEKIQKDYVTDTELSREISEVSQKADSIESSVKSYVDNQLTNYTKISQTEGYINAQLAELGLDGILDKVNSITATVDGINTEITSIKSVNDFQSLLLNRTNITAQKLSTFIGEYLESGETLASVIEQTAGGISMATVYNNLKTAGIDIANNGTTATGTVSIYGDQVKIKNTGNGQDRLWVDSSGMTNIVQAKIQSGLIANFKISGSYIGVNPEGSGNGMSLSDTQLLFRNSDSTRQMEALLNVYRGGVSEPPVLRVKNRVQTSSMVVPVYGIDFDMYTPHRNDAPPYAFYGTGMGVLDGPVTGYRVYNTTLSNNVMTGTHYSLGSIWRAYSVTATNYIELPTKSQLKEDLMVDSSVSYWGTTITIVNPGTSTLSVMSKTHDRASSTYKTDGPTMHAVRSSNVDSVNIGAKQAAIFTLVCTPSAYECYAIYGWNA